MNPTRSPSVQRVYLDLIWLHAKSRDLVPDDLSERSASLHGARAGQIEIEFVTKAEGGQWANLLGRLGLEPAPVTLPVELATQSVVVTLVALPEDLGPGSRFLSGQVQLAPLRGEEARWLLRLAMVRDLSPPADVVESSRLAGGYPGILERLTAGWPTGRAQTMTFRATFLVEESSWTSMLAPRKRPEPGTRHRGREKEVAILERASYTWKIDPPGTVTEITDAGRIGLGWVGVTCRGKLEADFGPQMFDRVEAESWGILSSFLRPAKRPRMAKRGRR